MKQAYEARFKKLDERLKQMETANSAGVGFRCRGVRGKPAPVPSYFQALSECRRSDLRLARGADQREMLFQEPTDSVQLALAAQEKPVRDRMERVLREYVDITGYFRAGYGRDDEGGPQVGFQAPGALAKGRLGNEAENYGELTIGKSFYLPGAFSLSRGPARERHFLGARRPLSGAAFDV